MTALECFTVIDESAGSILVSKREIGFLEKNMKGLSAEKVALLRALITVLH